MTRGSLLCALVIVFVALTANAASELSIKVDINQLIKHPKKYNGKRVDVTGYWVTSCEHCSDLYPSFNAEQKSPLSGNWVYLGKFAPNIGMPMAFRKRISKPYPDYDGYVRVVGKFEAVEMQKPKVVSRSDKMERVIINTRFWMDGHRVQANYSDHQIRANRPSTAEQHRSLSRATRKETNLSTKY